MSSTILEFLLEFVECPNSKNHKTNVSFYESFNRINYQNFLLVEKKKFIPEKNLISFSSYIGFDKVTININENNKITSNKPHNRKFRFDSLSFSVTCQDCPKHNNYYYACSTYSIFKDKEHLSLIEPNIINLLINDTEIEYKKQNNLLSIVSETSNLRFHTDEMNKSIFLKYKDNLEFI